MHRPRTNPLLLALVAGMAIGVLAPDAHWWDALMIVLLLLVLALFLWRGWTRC